ncbi:calmodulin-binding protein 25-like [Telopea speciosissima]|uniref:calmodulin-binding protein 25-like n=1 Tax=Telopea speciosissima TaxID=54955 RepID=UPI001CC3DF5E|nr:calmodulin-binding protein 25-like [Telopea speciosissima]
MASSDNLASLVEPWVFRPSFTDSWISDAFLRDTETLTKALQKSLSNESKTLTSDSNNNSALLQLVKSDPSPTPTSTISGSDPETAPKQQRRNTIGTTASGKISKRKSRASKRSQTTFITADPANFRQMVQQVTGIGFCNPHLPVDATATPVLKPEPQRLGTRLQSCLPTLDTSAFLLEHHHHQQQQQQIMGPTLATGHVSFAPVADGGAGLEFDSFPSFPTLESWRGVV